MVQVVHNFQQFSHEGYAFYEYRKSCVLGRLLILALIFFDDLEVGDGQQDYMGTGVLLCLPVSYFLRILIGEYAHFRAIILP